eukprot:6172161-Pleurochrysis_carterae.AAC.1
MGPFVVPVDFIAWSRLCQRFTILSFLNSRWKVRSLSSCSLLGFSGSNPRHSKAVSINLQFSRLVPVSSGHMSGFGAGVCPGTAPGVLIARCSAKRLWSSQGGSLEGNLQSP